MVSIAWGFEVRGWLGFRVSWHYDVIDDGTTGLPDGVADAYDPWYFFAYDDGWRLLATYRGDDSNPKQQFVHHMAGMGGLGGFGGSSYIDAVILRERDANTAWASAADGTLEERRYYVQNWRADVVAIVTSAGKLVERARYSSYGIPTAFPAGDTDCDGDWDASDSTDIGLNYTPGSAYAVRRDTDLDGDVDANDVTHANSITGGYQTLGRDVLTSPGVNNRIAYAGYQYDPTFAGVDRHLYHVRYRVYDAEAGRWTRRDPLGYVDGMGLYEYVHSIPVIAHDSMGLRGCRSSNNIAQAQHSEPQEGLSPPQIPDNDTNPFALDPLWCPPMPFQDCSRPQSLLPPLRVCCRPTETWDPFTHCEIKWGCALGERSYPIWTDWDPNRLLPDGTSCADATPQQIAQCVGNMPHSNRPNPTVPYGRENNCQSNTRDVLARCCLKSNWLPDSYACTLQGKCTRWVHQLLPGTGPGAPLRRLKVCVQWEWSPGWHDPNVPAVPDWRLPPDPFPRARPPQSPAPPGVESPPWR